VPKVLPNKITAQGWALAPIASATRPQRAPLTVILGGKKMPGTEDGPGPFAGATIGAALGWRPPTCGSGQPDLAAARPQGYRPKERDMAAAPESGSSPTSSPRPGPGGGARLSHVSPLDDLASPASVRANRPALGVPEARP
jgi:hypothetical protein